MKQYQVYVRRQKGEHTTGWMYGDTYTDPEIAMRAIVLARSKGFVTKTVTAKTAVQGLDNDVVSHA